MLKVEQIVVKYNNLQILKGVSFEVAPNEITIIVGSNGAGKSTTLRAVAGFAPVAEGKIVFKGNEIANLAPYKIVGFGISLIDENVRIFPYMTVLDNLIVGAYRKEAWAARGKHLEYMFDLFPRLRERRSQLARTLSGGERRMLGIARGLMSEPEMVMFDEPSGGLAPIVVMNIFEAIRKINEEGKTVLLVEQNVWESLSIGKNGYVIENGRIVMKGKCSELVSDPQIEKAYLRI